MSYKKGKGKIKVSGDVSEIDWELVNKLKFPVGAIDDLGEIDSTLKVGIEGDLQSDGGRLVEEKALSSVKSGLNAAMATNESNRDSSIAAAKVTADAALAAVQSDVDANELAASNARDAIQSALDDQEAKEAAYEVSNDAALAAQVAKQESERAAMDTAYKAADAALTASIAANEIARNASVEVIRAALQADVDGNEADGDTDRAAIRSELAAEVVALLGDVAADYDTFGKLEDKIQLEQGRVDAILNASQADKDSFAEIVALINSVDTENDDALAAAVLSINNSIATLQADVDGNESDSDTAIAAEASTARAAEGANATAIGAEETRALAAEAAIQADVDQNEADADAALSAMDAAYKAADATLTSAVALINDGKTVVGSFQYSDNQLKNQMETLIGNNEIARTTAIDAAKVTADAELAALQSDVDQNEADADAAIAALQADVDGNEAEAKGLINALEAKDASLDSDIAALQADVDQNEADADSAIAAVASDLSSYETSNDAALAAEISSTTTRFASASTARAAIQADVDQNEADADAAIAALQADVNQNEADADAEFVNVRNELAQEVTNLIGTAAGGFSTLGKIEDELLIERLRVDAILDSADADKNSFAEIVTLINSVDTENDTAFAGHVSAYNTKMTSLDAQDLTLQGNIDSLAATVSAHESDIEAKMAQEISDRLSEDAKLKADIDAIMAGKSSLAFQTDGGPLTADKEIHFVTTTQASQSIPLAGMAEKELRVVKLTADSSHSIEFAAGDALTFEGDAGPDGIVEMFPGAVFTFVVKSGMIHLL